MALPNNIMLSSEVVRFAPVSFNLDTEKIQRQIPLMEAAVFNGILGREWRAALIADIADYSAEPEWTAGTYNANDIVLWAGVYWIATATTTSQPAAGAVGWDFAPRFETSCNNDIYNAVLAQYLALAILQGCLTVTAMEVSAMGIGRKEGENFKPADMKELDRLATAIEGQKTLALGNLNYWILDSSCEFPLYEGATNSIVQSCCPLLAERTTDGTIKPDFKRPRFMVGNQPVNECLEDRPRWNY